MKMSQVFQDPFVTVVSVGIEDKSQQCTPKKAVNNSEYITVLTIGNELTKTIKEVTEEVIVYRLPGERLGFGLKFEGGTKAHEFVKRLFIQSCAPDSPASRVQSSWGQLVEGDEVLEIDSIPVNSMTRIDCVRFLKDSNVAIKLLVKHSFNTPYSKQKSKSSEDLPVIISTEEKKPPPVPPRKVHRKLLKNIQSSSENIQDNIVPTIKQLELFSSKSTRLQSPRNSFRKKYSPDVSRRLSDGSLGPPDAEVYLDLISQDSTQSLSESDDTGSTISTVLDRFASFPNTTTSSFSGSLPSTPTSIQKQLDLSYIVTDFPDDDFIPTIDKKFNKIEENNNILDGTEQKRCSDYTEGFDTENENTVNSETSKRPVVIPRSRVKINKYSSTDSTGTLPRLVDFVPKSPQKELNVSYDSLERFLDSERFDFEFSEQDSDENSDLDYNMDTYSSKWTLSSHLSTIGEDEEEQSSIQENSSNIGSPYFTPRVIIDTTDLGKPENTNLLTINKNMFSENECDKKVPMETPPSDPRQPPDGHEFPDFIETTSKATVFTDSCSLKSQECATNFKSIESHPVIRPLDRLLSSSNCDLRPKMTDSDEEKYVEKSKLLHARSQSLIDVSTFSEERSSSKWHTLMEQRKSRLSKLKGLVIPETAENDITPLVNIPEIKSITISQVDMTLKQENKSHFSRPVPAPISSVFLPSWSSNATLPKYSPAFKRKSLQVYATHSPKKSDSSDAESSYDEYINKYSGSTPSSRTTDDPKSLESIASPTRSDCSFDYTIMKTISINDNQYQNTRDSVDSDNDSAMSSSQSSYNSRSSPPPSPTSEEKLNAQNRMLKPSSLEAINRKNILASAKCRSGKDIKIGSPVIQRKGSIDEPTEKFHLQETLNIQEANDVMSEEDHATNISLKKIDNADNIYLRDQHIKSNAVLVNQPVVLEVSVERSAGISKVAEKPEEKPVPTKRTLAPAVTKDTKSQNELPKTRLESLLQKHSASVILEKRNKPVDIKSLKANFENSSMPVFPKSYKANGKTLPAGSSLEVGNGKPVVTTRRRSEELYLHTRRKSDDKLLLRPESQEEKPVLDTRRLSSGSLINDSISNIIKEEPVKIKRILLKKENYSANNSIEHKISSPTPSAELRTVELNSNQPGGSLGITLAGGVDYENKFITIHRIRYGSIAYQDGQLKKGDKVISINGIQTKGLTHSAATELLKAPVTKFTIVIEESKQCAPLSNLSRRISSSVSSLTSETKGHETETINAVSVQKKPTHSIHVVKDGAGLGFSIEGGKDSPKGDVPLVVKKIFAGGAADKSGELKVGDEILRVNQINFQSLSRIEAWSLMKKIPEGDVIIEIFR